MSLARTHRVKSTRKTFTCSGCRQEIPAGSAVVKFSVGFRGREQVRHDTPKCRPLRSELESTAVAGVYAAMEGIDWTGLSDTSSIEEAISTVAEACNEVADEYESNELYDINYDLQERAQTLRDAASELESWTPESDEPDEDDPDTWGGAEDYDEAQAAWLDLVRDEAEGAVDEVELP